MNTTSVDSVDSGVETGSDSSGKPISCDIKWPTQIDTGKYEHYSGYYKKTVETVTKDFAWKNAIEDNFISPNAGNLLLPQACCHKAGQSCQLKRCSHFESEITKRFRKIVKKRGSPYNKIKSYYNELEKQYIISQITLPQRMRRAAATNNIDMMKELLRNQTPNCFDDQGRTPLHYAACRGYTEMVRILLENGADPNQRDCIGNTPLHLAAVTSKISVVTLLLKAGTDVCLLDKYGYNPLQLALTKLKLFQNNRSGDMVKIKEEMHLVVDMLMVYLKKQKKNTQNEVEMLSDFCSRLSLSNTADQVQSDVNDLLTNINTLNISS